MPAQGGWPALVIPHGDGALRLRLSQSGGTVFPGGGGNGSYLRRYPFRLIRVTPRHVWRLRTDRSGRAQIAVPPGRYFVKRDWANHGYETVWKLDVRAGQTVVRQLFDSHVP